MVVSIEIKLQLSCKLFSWNYAIKQMFAKCPVCVQEAFFPSTRLTGTEIRGIKFIWASSQRGMCSYLHVSLFHAS
jgi:hypothetical protein